MDAELEDATTVDPARGAETPYPAPGEGPTSAVTVLLNAWRQGDVAAEKRLLEVLYSELRGLAEGFFRGERPSHTLQPTALVHEAYLRLLGQADQGWKNRAHFFAIAARMMRRVLVDHARSHNREKRGGQAERVPIEFVAEELLAISEPRLLDLDSALDHLATIDADKARLVELRFFAGLTINETAECLGVSEATVFRQWRLARAWLFDAMKRGPGSEHESLESH